MSGSGERRLQGAAALLGWVALGVQLLLLRERAAENGLGAAAAVGTFLAYFTILTNIGAALSFTTRAVASTGALGRWFASPVVATGLVVSLTLVGVVYSLLLRAIWNPVGAQKFADVVMHDVMPVLLLADWFRHVPKGTLHWRDLPSWFVYPTLYLAYSMGRSTVSGWYPYPFLDLTLLSAGDVARNALIAALAVAVLGAAAIVIDRRLGAHAR